LLQLCVLPLGPQVVLHAFVGDLPVALVNHVGVVAGVPGKRAHVPRVGLQTHSSTLLARPYIDPDNPRVTSAVTRFGKGEADSSILSSSTILHFPSKRPYCRPDASWKLAGRSVWSHSPFSACAAVRPVAAATPGFRSQETSKPQSRLKEK